MKRGKILRNMNTGSLWLANRIPETTVKMRLFVLLGAGALLLGAQSAVNSDFEAAKRTAETNWVEPPITANAGKDVTGVLSRDVAELNAVKFLYRNASSSVRGSVAGALLGANASVKVTASSILTGHHCPLPAIPADADDLTRLQAQVSAARDCLRGQVPESMGKKIANNGYARALTRQLTFGIKGNLNQQEALVKGTDPMSAGRIDFAVQEVVNNFPTNQVDAEIAREQNSPAQAADTQPAVPPKAQIEPTNDQDGSGVSNGSPGSGTHVSKWREPIKSPVTKDVKSACEADDPENQAYCFGILQAYYDAAQAEADTPGYVATTCIPENASGEQLRAAFLEETQKEPDQLLGPVQIFYSAAMQSRFPCQKKSSMMPRGPAAKRP